MSKNTHITEDNADVFVLTILLQETVNLYSKLKIEPFMTRSKTSVEVCRLNQNRIELAISYYYELMHAIDPTMVIRDLSPLDKDELIIDILVGGIVGVMQQIDDNLTPLQLAKNLIEAGYSVVVK